MARYAVIGAEGMLGRAWCEFLVGGDHSYRAFTRSQVDLCISESLHQIAEGTDYVINCAAYTNVDGAEADEELATEINGYGVGRLGEKCREIGATLVHYSTDYVFDGCAREPYDVDHALRPINAYGRSKVKGEELLKSSGAQYLLLRTSWVYAPWAKNFVLTMLALGESKEELRVVDDQIGRPSSAQKLALHSYELLKHKARGTFHLCDGGECSWFDFASAIMEIAGLPCKVLPCTSEEFPRPARRPSYGVMSLEKTEALLGSLPTWRDNLRDVLEAR